MPSVKIATPRTTAPAADNNSQAKRTTTPPVTLNETFLPNVKILKPVDGLLPNPKEILKNSPKKRVVVGISGVSCGGKTTVSSAVKLWLQNYGELIMQDDYYKPASELEINPFTKIPEFDEPTSLKMWEIREAIKKWAAVPSAPTDPTRVLIVEGTMIFTDAEICELCDLRYLVHVSSEVARYRRSLRNYPIPDPPGIVEKHIWPKYIKHRQIFVNLAEENGFICKQIDGTIPVEYTVAGIIQDVRVNKHR